VARIAGVDIPDNKHIVIALTYIYGIGPESSRRILKKADIPYNVKTKDLREDQTVKIRDIIEDEYKIEGSLRSEGVLFAAR
jgi:small subunit ribosomal protein S13